MSSNIDTVGKLNDRQANIAARFAIGEWIRHSGPEALLVWQRLEKARLKGGSLEPWIIDPTVDEKKAADISRRILRTFLDVGQLRDAELSLWAQEGIKLAAEARAQVFDPVSAAVIGTLAIGLVLAARVKKIGSTEFFKGLPGDLGKLVRSVAGSLNV